MIENIKLTERQIKDAGCFFSKIKVSIKTGINGGALHEVIFSSDAHGWAYYFASDSENPKDFYYQMCFDIDVYDRDRLLNALNINHSGRLTFL